MPPLDAHGGAPLQAIGANDRADRCVHAQIADGRQRDLLPLPSPGPLGRPRAGLACGTRQRLGIARARRLRLRETVSAPNGMYAGASGPPPGDITEREMALGDSPAAAALHSIERRLDDVGLPSGSPTPQEAMTALLGTGLSYTGEEEEALSRVASYGQGQVALPRCKGSRATSPTSWTPRPPLMSVTSRRVSCTQQRSGSC